MTVSPTARRQSAQEAEAEAEAEGGHEQEEQEREQLEREPEPEPEPELIDLRPSFSRCVRSGIPRSRCRTARKGDVSEKKGTVLTANSRVQTKEGAPHVRERIDFAVRQQVQSQHALTLPRVWTPVLLNAPSSSGSASRFCSQRADATRVCFQGAEAGGQGAEPRDARSAAGA